MVVNSTTDIVNALVAKGVLTEEEGALLNKGREGEAAGQAKALKKAGKLTVSDAIDNATIYGDIRLRYEGRDNGAFANGFGSTNIGTNAQTAVSHTDLQRSRYKVTLGVNTKSGDFYSDLALVMGAKGRSDNANFGVNASNELDSKNALFLKRAMVGYKATDWLTIEAGRIANPLYTSSMVWDADLNLEGLAEKFTYKIGDSDLFFTAIQSQYAGVRKLVGIAPGVDSANATNTVGSSEQFIFQGGVRQLFNDKLSGKVAATYTTYSKSPYRSNFGGNFVTATGSATVNTANSSGGDLWGVNDLNVWEIPAEVNYMVADNIGIRAFEHFAWNTSADDRARNSTITAAANGSQSSDDIAWTVGFQVAKAKDLKAFEGNKMAKGDWSAKLWYQSVGAWSVDAAAVDSDIFDGRTNMEGVAFKAQYNAQDNVLLNFTAASAKKKNHDLYAFGIGDIAGDLDKLDLMQFDVTYKF